jgi:regulator of sigma E protease
MFTFIVFILVLGLLVFVHEFGHFYLARRNGITVHEFGFGFPPRLFGFRKVNGKYELFWGNKEVESEDTIYSVNALPLGGFVKIKGEQGEDADAPDSFANKSIWARFQVLVAGVVMNFLLAYVIFALGFMIGLPIAFNKNDAGLDMSTLREQTIQVTHVRTDSPADAAGLEMSDRILKVNNQPVQFAEDLVAIVEQNAEKSISIEVERAGEVMILEATPENIDGVGKLGFGPANVAVQRLPWYQALYRGGVATITMTWAMLSGFAMMIANLVSTGSAGVELSGPVGIAVMTGKFAEQGFVYLMQFAALLSINLGVLNLLPFPALDGGRIVFLAIEKIRNKPVSKHHENMVHMVGFLLFLALMFMVTFKDIARFF